MTDVTTAASSIVDLPDVGSVVAGKFRLEELIGEGGQAWIWKARHLELDSDVALKVLRSANADATQTERLRKEARAVARLSHPSIVRVFDLGETPLGQPYFVMELLEGENLADALARTGKMAPIEAVRLLLPIASAVAAVHAVGVVHRDLKPDNVFLARNSHAAVQPKLLDFGVAKHEAHKNRQLKLTEVGAVLGSPAYLSPEQARGQSDVDARADIWSFCTMLYECVTGTVPFHASNTHALLFSIAEDQPLSLADHGVDEIELWQILRRGLEKSPSDRWPNMRTLGRALAQWLSDRNVTSDVTGVVLESTWFNPEIVTPPPIMSKRSDSISDDEPAWSKRSGIASHVETKAVAAVAVPPPRRSYRGVAVILTFLVSVGTAVIFLTGTTRGASSLQRLQRSATGVGLRPKAPVVTGRALRSFANPPRLLDYGFLARTNAALVPGLPYALIPVPVVPVVPVEKLRLVSGPSGLRVVTPKPATVSLTASPAPGAGPTSGADPAPAAAAPAPAAAAAPAPPVKAESSVDTQAAPAGR